MPLAAEPMVFVVIRQRSADPVIAHPTVMPKRSVASMAKQEHKTVLWTCVVQNLGKKNLEFIHWRDFKFLLTPPDSVDQLPTSVAQVANRALVAAAMSSDHLVEETRSPNVPSDTTRLGPILASVPPCHPRT